MYLVSEFVLSKEAHLEILYEELRNVYELCGSLLLTIEHELLRSREIMYVHAVENAVFHSKSCVSFLDGTKM